jgi:hypothetical protein
MKKETLEEAAKKYINDDLDLYESLVDGHISYNIGIDLLNKLFIAGAKYEAERMYSEEDMRQAFIAGGNSLIEEDDDYGTEYDAYMEDWFEQNKKK